MCFYIHNFCEPDQLKFNFLRGGGGWGEKFETLVSMLCQG